MELEKIKAMVGSPAWPKVEEYLQEQIRTTQLGLEVATSEQEVYRKQGSLAILRQMERLREQVKK
jgi:hypothetical protein